MSYITGPSAKAFGAQLATRITWKVLKDASNPPLRRLHPEVTRLNGIDAGRDSRDRGRRERAVRHERWRAAEACSPELMTR
jgi:hypothetical protein